MNPSENPRMLRRLGGYDMICRKNMVTVVFAVIATLCAIGPTGAFQTPASDGPTGPYNVVENWPKPLPDTRHSHNGWTWGSMGGVFAETPDRIWIAQRGE